MSGGCKYLRLRCRKTYFSRFRSHLFNLHPQPSPQWARDHEVRRLRYHQFSKRFDLKYPLAWRRRKWCRGEQTSVQSCHYRAFLNASEAALGCSLRVEQDTLYIHVYMPLITLNCQNLASRWHTRYEQYTAVVRAQNKHGKIHERYASTYIPLGSQGHRLALEQVPSGRDLY